MIGRFFKYEYQIIITKKDLPLPPSLFSQKVIYLFKDVPISQLWLKILRRRSHKHKLTWERMKRLIARWIPFARICHPYPFERFGVIN
jgi:hypothetical protein